ncbi:MAG: alanine racemase [Candidatus Zixiibacteriota bacterium]
MAAKYPLQWIELSRSALNCNVDSLVRLARGRQIAICVKANAYGHGLPQIVEMLSQRSDIHYLSVHSVAEAIACRKAGWNARLLLLGPVATEDIETIVECGFEPTISDAAFLERLGRAADKAKKRILTHLKLETGTNRQGITESELPRFAEIYRKHQHLGKPYGASTHFANIEDTTNHQYAEHQLRQFGKLVKAMKRLKIGPRICHTASSAALILFEKTGFDLVRPGLAAYGHWPSKETYLSYRLSGGANDLFRPVLSWKSRLTQVKKLQPGEFVGYGCTYRTTAPARLGVVPVGYYDGYDRALSNCAHMLVNGARAEVRGRVCMNLTMIDISNVRAARPGHVVTLIGSDHSETVSAEQIAIWSSTINYEVLARLSSETPRIMVE